MNDPIRVRRVGAAEAAARVSELADLLIACVRAGGSVSFLWPLATDKATAFWRHVGDGVARGERALLIAESPDGRLVGTVQLVLALPENQPHRADVAKLLVHPDTRRQGIAQRLMKMVDTIARDERRTLLVLDTVTGDTAERLYPRVGWQRVGEIPDYALRPDGTPCSTTVFYKAIAS
jgi:GNAT superfamily N-acetyltransferase